MTRRVARFTTCGRLRTRLAVGRHGMQSAPALSRAPTCTPRFRSGYGAHRSGCVNDQAVIRPLVLEGGPRTASLKTSDLTALE